MADGDDARLPGRFGRTARAIATAPIVFYQRFISPGIPRRCRYEPTCSHYGVQAIQAVRHTEGTGARGLAVAALQPLEPGRV